MAHIHKIYTFANMKTMRNIFIAIAAMFCQTTMADTYEWLNIMYNDGTEVSTSLADFSNITFENGVMKLNNGTNVVKSFDTKTLRKMYFKADNTAIDLPAINTDADAPTVIVNAAGMVVGNSVSDIEKLPRGLYIVKQGNNVKKIAKQ